MTKPASGGPGGAPTQRRSVRYQSLSDIRADADRLAIGPVRTCGRWTYGQILQHLGDTVHCAFDGFGFQAPWWARTFIAPFMKNSFLTKTMPAGFTLPKAAAKLLPGDVSTEQALANLHRALDRLEQDAPGAAHPFFGKLASQEWLLLTLRHCELHMSFAQPGDS